MSSYTALADALSRIEEQRGNALARGAEQRGQIWGNAIGGLGSLIAGIPEQRARLAEAQQRQQLGQIELQKAQGAQQAQSALDLAMQHAVTANPDGTYSPNRDLVRQELTGKGFAHVLPALEKSWAESDKITAEGREAKQKVVRGEAEDVAAMATRGLSLLDSGVDPSDVAGTLLPDIAAHTANGVIERPHGDAITSQIGAARSDPKALRTLFEGWQQASKEQMEGMNAKAQAGLRNAEAPGAAAESAQKQQVAANMQGGLTADQQADNARAEASVGRSELAQQETARHNRAMEGAAAKRLAVQGAGTPGTAGQLSPEGLDLAATQYRVTGQMPPMGMGRTPERFAVINKAAEQSKILNQTPAATIQKQAAFKADSNALKQMQTLSSGAEASENKAVGQIELIRDLSKKVPRTQVPLLNNAILSGKINLLGDPDAQQLANAIQTFSNEYGKIIEGSTASVAGASDSSRRASAKLVSAAMNPQQLEGVLKLMQREMDLTLAGYDASINHITTKMGGGGAAPAAPANRVYYDANGNPIKGK